MAWKRLCHWPGSGSVGLGVSKPAPGTRGNPAAASAGARASAASRSGTASCRSMTSLAFSPGTAVEPMWCSRAVSRSSAGRTFAIRFISRCASCAQSSRCGSSTGPLFRAARFPAARFRAKGTSRWSQSRSTWSSRSCTLRELSRKTSAAASRSSRVAWAAMRERAASAVIPRCSSIRWSRTSSGASTTTTRWKSLPWPVSTSNGMSCTTTASSGAAAMISAARERTSGWTIEFRTASRSGLPNTVSPSLARLRRPPSPSISSPNSATIRARPRVPGSTTSRASASASTNSAPRSLSREAATDFPDAIPPVNPIFSTLPP
ncbi:hypothetical protein ARTHRO9AX_150085 [Arthrobacter sp. 9AX]|nr:hypothetical protein ARTHRO9AX_150085 [Arthrobacter sp. 9AX]